MPPRCRIPVGSGVLRGDGGLGFCRGVELPEEEKLESVRPVGSTIFLNP